MKAIVTGATGFLGRYLVQELIDKEYEIVAIIRNPQKIPPEWKGCVKPICIELGEIASLINCETVEDCDAWYHLGWEATSGAGRADTEVQLNNVLGTCNAIETAEIIGCKKFINAGSIMEYEAMQYLASDLCTPGEGYIYSIAKLCADFMAKTISHKRTISYSNIIISNIFGAGEVSPRFLNSVLRKLMNNEIIRMTEGKQLYDFIYVTDAARKIVFVGENGEDKNAYYLGNPEQKTLREYVITMKEVCNSESELFFGAIAFNGPYLDYSVLDTGKIERLGCSNNVSFEEGIQKTIRWMKETEQNE